MREQKGYVFRKGKSWFVRYCDDVRQADGSIKRVQVCRKLPVPYDGSHGQFASARRVQPFADELLRPVNAGRRIRNLRCHCTSSWSRSISR